MRVPNTAMRCVLGHRVLARDNVTVRIDIYGGESTLSYSERRIMENAASAYPMSSNNITTELLKTRTRAATYNTSNAVRTQGYGKFALNLGLASWAMSSTAGIEMGLMVLYVGSSTASAYVAVVLSMGVKGSGADVEVDDIVSTSNMGAGHTDFIIEIE